jgi:hypothetical protein
MIVGELMLWFSFEKGHIQSICIVGLLVKLTEQARVVFVRLRCYSNVALKLVVISLGFLSSVVAKITI